VTKADFRISISLQLYTKINTAIMIITYTTAYVRSLSSFRANVVEIFEMVERWVVVDGWVGVSSQMASGQDADSEFEF